MTTLIHTLALCNPDEDVPIRLILTTRDASEQEIEVTFAEEDSKVDAEPTDMYKAGFKCVEKITVVNNLMVWTWSKGATTTARKYARKK